MSLSNSAHTLLLYLGNRLCKFEWEGGIDIKTNIKIMVGQTFYSCKRNNFTFVFSQTTPFTTPIVGGLTYGKEICIQGVPETNFERYRFSNIHIL